MESIIILCVKFLDCFAYDNILSSFFNTDKKEWEKGSLFAINFLLTNILLGKYMVSMGIIKILIVFTARFICFYIIYKQTYIIPVLLIWEVVASTLEVVGFAVPMTILGMSLDQIKSNIILNAVISIGMYMIMYATSFIIKKFIVTKLEIKYISKKEWIIISVYHIVNYAVIYQILYSGVLTNNVNSIDLIICLALMIMSVMLLYITSEFCKSNKIKREMAVLEREQKVQQNSLQSMEQAYKKQRQLTHDYNNRLEMLRIIRQKNDYSELEEALNSMTGNNNRIRTVVTTQNTIIDAVLNQKYAKAMELGIGMEFNLQYLKDLPIDSQDIGIILANAIDNAISAADKAKQKFVQIFMSYEDEMFLCAIRNIVDKKVKIVNKSVVKEDDDLTHGYGIANIKRILEKYNSNFLIECDDKYFILTFMISLL